MHSLRRLLVFFIATAGALWGDPLSKKIDVDFYHSIASRDLHGLAARSDGRLVSGPFLTELEGPAPAELLWTLAPGAAPGEWFVGTGPDGKIFEVTVDAAKSWFSSTEVVSLDDRQVFALKRFENGDLLAGTSPKGRLALIRSGKILAEAGLPADSVLDIAALGTDAALVATGDPGRIYRIGLAKFASSGVDAERIKDDAALAARGITLFGEIRDRNVRRVAVLSDGSVAAGSSPRGNVYLFPAPTGTSKEEPIILQENHDAEVTDLLPGDGGSFLAAITFTGLGNSSNSEKPKDDGSTLAKPEKFSGRSLLVSFPSGGFPETLAARANAAFYKLARKGGIVLIAGGEQGDLTGYDFESQMALTFPGSTSARLSGISAVPGSPDRFFVLRNNAPGLALVDFVGSGIRHAETQQIDLGTPARMGAVRFDRVRDFDELKLGVQIRASNGSDELEGWGPWTKLSSTGDGWRGSGLRGRYFKLRLSFPADAASDAELDAASLYYLPQNRRPELQDFHFISQNYQLVTPPPPNPPVVSTLAQLMQQQGREEAKQKNFFSSQVVPAPGMQVAFWTVTDPGGDPIVCTFSIRKDGESQWRDIAVDTTESYVQFDTSHLPDGVYFTRLVATQAAPLPKADRLSATFETDDLVVDHTPPDILDIGVQRQGGSIVVTVHGRDALSLLQGIAVTFNNGLHDELEQPVGGILDGREETFVLEEPVDRTAGATNLEVSLFDSAGNQATRRLDMPR